MCSKKWTIIISFIIILVMGGRYTFLQLRLYTPELNIIECFYKKIVNPGSRYLHGLTAIRKTMCN